VTDAAAPESGSGEPLAADPVPAALRVPDRWLVALTLGLALALLIVTVVSLLVWHTPDLHPVSVSSRGQA
jgi:hypothetical protein